MQGARWAPRREGGGEDEGLPSPRPPPSPCPPLRPWTSLLTVRRETGIPRVPERVTPTRPLSSPGPKS